MIRFSLVLLLRARGFFITAAAGRRRRVNVAAAVE